MATFATFVLLQTLILATLAHYSPYDHTRALKLSSLIESGQIHLATDLSRVKLLGIESYTGFITVDKKYDSNLFFWFFPALELNPDAPLLLWLQGGPGSSSMLGLFVEHGPYYLTRDLKLMKRNFTWNRRYNVLYVDNPAGTGFSFTNNDKGYARNQDDVAKNMYNFLQQFYKMFPRYKKSDFYVTGESYGGKYVPSVAYHVHNMNKNASSENYIPLKGIAVGNGLSDPQVQFDYADFLYQIGLADLQQKNYINAKREVALELIKKQDWLGAFHVFDELINGDKFKYPTYFKNITGLNYYLNYKLTNQPGDLDYFSKFLDKPEVRKLIHVGNRTFHDPSDVESHLLEDIMKSVKYKIDTLLDNYKVLIYSGNMDIIVPTSTTAKLVDAFDWKYSVPFKGAKRVVYKIRDTNTQVSGYAKSYSKFSFVILRNAGHLVPFDQPAVAYDMITRFVDGKNFTNIE